MREAAGLVRVLTFDGESGPTESPRHAHDGGQFYAIERGLMAVDVGSGWWLMPPGRIGWLPPRWPHAGRDHGPVWGRSIYLAPELCGALPDKPAVFSLSPFLAAVVRRMEDFGGETGAEDRLAGLARVLLDELAEAIAEPLHVPMPEDPRLARIARDLVARPDDRRTLDQWARDAGMSRRSLSRRVLEETGLSFGRWRARLRLTSAVRLLVEGRSVTEVAFAVGFESVSAFIAGFRAHFGVTPARYRRESGEKQVSALNSGE